MKRKLLFILLALLCAGCADFLRPKPDPVYPGILKDETSGISYSCSDIRVTADREVICRFDGGTVFLKENYSLMLTGGDK